MNLMKDLQNFFPELVITLDGDWMRVEFRSLLNYSPSQNNGVKLKLLCAFSKNPYYNETTGKYNIETIKQHIINHLCYKLESVTQDLNALEGEYDFIPKNLSRRTNACSTNFNDYMEEIGDDGKTRKQRIASNPKVYE